MSLPPAQGHQPSLASALAADRRSALYLLPAVTTTVMTVNLNLNVSNWTYDGHTAQKLSMKVHGSQCRDAPLLRGKTATRRLPEHEGNTTRRQYQETATERNSKHSSEAVFAHLEHLLHLLTEQTEQAPRLLCFLIL